MSGEPRFFATAAAFRRWLASHHASSTELLVGFYKKGSGKKSITYPEALDEALCFGWIDGVRRRLDDDRYVQRFSPRAKRSVWSAINIRHVERLKQARRMQPAGLRAYEGRDPARTQQYSYERTNCAYGREEARALRGNAAAWTFLSAQSPSYQRLMCWYVMSAKKPETRERRIRRVVEASARGLRL